MTPLRIIVTGASGFFGAGAAEMLAQNGHHLGLMLRDPSKAWRVKDLIPKADVITGDMMDRQSYGAALRDFKPDLLLHAGWNGVSGTTRDAAQQMQNVSASVDLLTVAIDAGATHFIGIGSQAEYGPQNKKLDEDAPTLPTTLYGESKLAACRATHDICEQRNVRFAWLRLFSAYGPRDNPDWLIPSMIAKIRRGEKPSLTACEQLWDFVHIDDAARAAVDVAQSNASGIFNLGGGAAPPLHQTIKILRDLIDPAAPLGLGDLPYAANQVMHLEADITRLTRETGWSPQIRLAEGLKETVDYFIRSEGTKALPSANS